MKPRASLVYLARPKKFEKLNDLKKSLVHLDRHFNEAHNYPITIFHEDYEQKEFDAIRSTSSSTIEFIKLPNFLELPSYPGLTQEQVERWISGEDFGRPKAPLGYRHMCRFYAYPIFHHEALASYDYYWRFDDDSYLLGDVKEDPFAFMEKHGYVYGYRSVEYENLSADGIGLDRLWKLTKQFAKKHRLSLKQVKKRVANWKGRYTGIYYYNNFEINKISFWRESSLYTEYFKMLDRSLGFFQFRWGDSSVRILAANLLLKKSQIHHFDDIPYRHNHHYSLLRSEEVRYVKHENPDDLLSVLSNL
ncbi:MAG: hypothetical protein KDK55_00445 [Chlamydiia bacterium]|nr:hypothetical protein [Chlamydiia bacterium]